MEWLKHAFAVEAPADDAPTHDQLAIVDLLCHEIRRRRLTPAAVAFLEMSRPLNFVSSQAMHFFQPILSAVADVATYEQFAKFLERRDSIDIILERLEAESDSDRKANATDHNHKSSEPEMEVCE